MINKLHEIPTFSLFNNYEIIRKMKFKINEIIDAINSPAPAPSGSGINYSYEEQKIGTAFGEDLYQKTFIIDRTDEQSFIDNTVQFPEIKNFISTDIYLMDIDNPISSTEPSIFKLKLNQYASNTTKATYEIYDYPDDSVSLTPAEIAFSFGTAYSSDNYPYLFATIQYTKRTA